MENNIQLINISIYSRKFEKHDTNPNLNSRELSSLKFKISTSYTCLEFNSILWSLFGEKLCSVTSGPLDSEYKHPKAV